MRLRAAVDRCGRALKEGWSGDMEGVTCHPPPCSTPPALEGVPLASEALLPVSLLLNPLMSRIHCVWESSARLGWQNLLLVEGREAPVACEEWAGSSPLCSGRGLGDLLAKLFTNKKSQDFLIFFIFLFFKLYPWESTVWLTENVELFNPTGKQTTAATKENLLLQIYWRFV